MKIRLDQLLLELGLAEDLEQAGKKIMAGKVRVDEVLVDKVGTLVKDSSLINVDGGPPFVTRGGEKLEPALRHFNIDLLDRAVLDVGASHGGFTDCMLKAGARKVYALDVGKGLLDFSLRKDPRVKVLEEVNARKIDQLPIDTFAPRPDLAVCDLSFISLKLVISPVLNVLKRPAQLLMLIKPQFELPAQLVSKGGVVEDPELHQRACADVIEYCRSLKLDCSDPYASPVRGLKKGNQEFFVLASTVE